MGESIARLESKNVYLMIVVVELEAFSFCRAEVMAKDRLYPTMSWLTLSQWTLQAFEHLPTTYYAELGNIQLTMTA